MEKENISFHALNLVSGCPACTGAEQRPCHFLHTVLSLSVYLYLFYNKDEYNKTITNKERSPGWNRLCITLLSEEAFRGNGTLQTDFFLPHLLKCRAGENFSRSLVKPLTQRAAEVNSAISYSCSSNFIKSPGEGDYIGVGFFWQPINSLPEE